jgi:F-type H+-transporting ATPase subunit a
VFWNLPEIKVPLDPVFYIGPYPVYNTVLLAVINALFLLLLFGLVARRAKIIPTPFQNFVEWVMQQLLDICEEVAGKQNGRRFFPWVATLFFFILFANWWEVIPGVETIGWTHVQGIFLRGAQSNQLQPWLRPPSTDLNFTIGLAVVSVIATQIYGFKVLGVGKQLGRYFAFKEGPMGLLVGVFELLLEPLRIISLGFRLFGNLFAGDALLLVMSFLIPVVGAVPFYALEVFIGFIQAFVFAFLTLIFMTLGTTAHGHDEPEEEHVAESSRAERAHAETQLAHLKEIRTA